MKRLRRIVFNGLVIAAALLPLAAACTANQSPYHVGGDRYWFRWDEFRLRVEGADGSGFRELYAWSTVPAYVPGVLLPIGWLAIHWRDWKRRPAHATKSSFTPTLLGGVFLACLPLAGLSAGQTGVSGRLAIALVLFLFITMAGAFLHLFLGVFYYIPIRRRQIRLQQGLCGQCGYCLVGNVSGVCPECGDVVAIPAHESRPSGPIFPA